MILGFDHVALPVADLPRAVAFYRDVLGMRVVDARDPQSAAYCWMGFGAAQSLNLALAPDATPNARSEARQVSTSPHAAFLTTPEALDAYAAKLEELALLVEATPGSVYFTDPDGNFLELTCWREARLKAGGARHW